MYSKRRLWILDLQAEVTTTFQAFHALHNTIERFPVVAARHDFELDCSYCRGRVEYNQLPLCVDLRPIDVSCRCSHNMDSWPTMTRVVGLQEAPIWGQHDALDLTPQAHLYKVETIAGLDLGTTYTEIIETTQSTISVQRTQHQRSGP